MPLTRRQAIAGCGGGLAWLASFPAQAQAAYPSRTIKMIVPYPAGGTTDLLGRLVADQFKSGLNNGLGATVVVENKPGAGTTLGADQVAKSEPDGYTLLMATSTTLAINKTLYKKLPYDPVKDFAPIGLVAAVPFALIINPEIPARTLVEFIAYAKSKPGLAYGSAGNGSPQHLGAEMLKSASGIDIRHVPYRGGAPALNDVLAGQIPMTFATVSQALAQYQGGLVRALGVAATKRQSAIPDVPTFGEQGSDLQVSEWYVLLAPAGTPRPIVTKLNAELRRIMAQPGLGDKLVGVDLQSSSPEEARAYIKSEIERWAPVIRKLGLKPE
jgi:tripartite-type tricarboxylate transporter receptor subunit TctC